MSISRPVVIPLLAAVFAFPSVAQTPPASDSAALLPPVKLHSDSSDRIRVDQFRLPSEPLLDSDSREHTAAGLSRNDLQPSQGFPLGHFLKPDTVPEDLAATCYSMRSYRVKRDDPQTDVTRPAGYSTCQPATRFAVKSAVDSRELLEH
jgi:hypothetical protein